MKTLKAISNEMEASIKRLAEERDRLRDLEEEIAGYREIADRAVEALEESVEILSEQF
jgi:predicted  nucleic acid-binding Zn-ribbon protein